MDEFQIWSVLSSFLISNALYQAGVFFILWVAFRAANLLKNEDPMMNRVLLSLFSAGIIFNGLTVSALLTLNLQSTAHSLAQMGASSANAVRFIADWGVEGVPEMSLVSNPIMAGWWLVVAIMLFGKIWQTK
ncbi:MAG: hypothetical protein EVB03_05985 [SAR92 clade bacterium]|uniref:Uncharacterized protein n=1 Tax=SAR92 clade bacterium TaxID=2315479 RepID=A0A520MFB4_9GAMM|nr:MAG: hypothetical protein EVB03_05985 [SAR92 clade bacterium]